MLKQPSTSMSSPDPETILGLISTIGPSPTSITTIFLLTPTWGAARPTPSAAYIVSIMFWISLDIFFVIFVTGSVGCLSTGSPSFTIFNTAILTLLSKIDIINYSTLLIIKTRDPDRHSLLPEHRSGADPLNAG